MTKSQIIKQLLDEEHCFNAYWTQQDKLIVENKKIFCAKCNTILAQFNEVTGLWDQV